MSLYGSSLFTTHRIAMLIFISFERKFLQSEIFLKKCKINSFFKVLSLELFFAFVIVNFGSFLISKYVFIGKKQMTTNAFNSSNGTLNKVNSIVIRKKLQKWFKNLVKVCKK